MFSSDVVFWVQSLNVPMVLCVMQVSALRFAEFQEERLVYLELRT